MKSLTIFPLLLMLLIACSVETETMTQEDNSKAESFYDFRMPALDGSTVDFSKYKGKKVLVVNTASECGYTPQYADLQNLYEKYENKLVILGFPANNFGGQEPGANEEISTFCRKNYGVTFPMFSKIDVVGKQKSPLYKWLESKTGEEPNWNFCKYLINEKGEVVQYYPSGVNPFDDALVRDING